MKFKLTTDSLAHTLLDEMQEVLGLLEQGNTGRAFRLLEARCRPGDPMKQMPTCDGDPSVRRVMAEMLELLPAALVRAPYRRSLEVAAQLVARANERPGWLHSPENSLSTAMVLAHWGLVLQVDEEAELNIDTEYAALFAMHPEIEGATRPRATYLLPIPATYLSE